MNNPDFIYNLKVWQKKKERLNYNKEGEEYMQDRNKFEEGKFLLQSLFTEQMANPNQQLTNRELETLIV